LSTTTITEDIRHMADKPIVSGTPVYESSAQCNASTVLGPLFVCMFIYVSAVCLSVCRNLLLCDFACRYVCLSDIQKKNDWS